jgi:serine/threonine protein kinase
MMHELQPGDPQLIGPYRLRGRLGTGGMGRVYLGQSPGGGPVAVKVIRADLAQDPEFLARFRREVAVARKVSGLFTAPVIDADLDGPVPWLATAFVSGPSLAEAVSEHGPLPTGSVLALAKGLAEGLSAIHAAGVVHRDLKPANVLLAADGPRVIDFGISRAVEASALTHTGLVVGSPGFMSPEQAEGREVGPPSDIFSLGAVLAFAATGQGPFGTGSTPALVYRVVYSLPNLDRLPAEVRPLVERCLAKDPAQRPTASALLAGTAHPATGWLPEPVTSAFSQVGAPRAVTVTQPRGPLPAPPLAPPPGPGRAEPGRPHRRAARRPWRGRWRPLTAAAILAGLLGAGVTAGFTMTADSAPAHAAQSVRRDVGSAPLPTLAPASSPASYASSSSATTTPRTTPSATAPAYVPPSTPPTTMAPPLSTSASPSTSSSPSTSWPPSTPPAPSTAAPTTPAGY